MCKVRSFKKLDNRVRILLGRIQTFFDDLYPRQGTVGIRSPGHGMNAQQSELTVSQGFPSCGFNRGENHIAKQLKDKRAHTLGG